MAQKKTKAKKPARASDRVKLTAKGKAMLPPADAVGYQFRVGQRVTVTAPGSFAARQLGTVDAIEGEKVFVMLDHKQAAKAFRCADLAAA